ncbi:MAG: hypothetical protein KJO98_01175 [Rhodothermia bacterium]|nr:hypothetical protein [Rhodothermia bacterium]
MISKCISTAGYLVAIAVTVGLGSGCSVDVTPDEVIDRAMRAHGTTALDNAVLEFEFRGDLYQARRNDGLFSYERHWDDTSGTIRDVVNNDEIFREVNGQRIELTERLESSILTRVNSIIYFASLPYSLRDPAVIARHLGVGSIDGNEYDRVEVTFRKQGGGPDYRDRFLYWVNRSTSRIDYFAYYYLTDETGSRLRKLVNVRNVNGFLMADHLNFAAATDTIGSRIEAYEPLIGTDGLDLVSEVKHENVRIVPL